MKTVEQIQKEITRLQTENEINWEAKGIFESKNNPEKANMYLEMIKQNDIKVEILKWVTEE